MVSVGMMLSGHNVKRIFTSWKVELRMRKFIARYIMPCVWNFCSDLRNCFMDNNAKCSEIFGIMLNVQIEFSRLCLNLFVTESVVLNFGRNTEELMFIM